MAYADIGDIASGAVITEGYLDQIRANFLVSPIAIVTTKGDMAVATAANAMARLGIGPDDATLVADDSQTTGQAWQIQPAARVYNDAAIDPATDSWVKLTFNTERYDTDTVHDTSTDTERLTIPANGGGLYHIGGNVDFDNGGGVGNNDLGIRILLNNATVIAQKLTSTNITSVDVSMGISCDYALVATDYVELQVYTSGDVNILAAGNYSPEFWCHWFRRA